MPVSDLLSRAVVKVIPHALAERKLAAGTPLRVYLGIDPTSSKLHLGHAVPLRKLRAFADSGHHAILLFGTFTAMLGDPSGRDRMRIALTREDVQRNITTYQQQVAKIIDLEGIDIVENHTWLDRLSQHDLIRLASQFTKQQMEQREMFARREREGNPIHLHEFLYPLYQGYDSIQLDVDCEIGATDQEFNMLAGRRLQQAFGKREKFIVTLPLLEGLDGRKMSKTYDNCIWIEDGPREMYGKLLSIHDHLIGTYMERCTDIPLPEIRAAEKAMGEGANPKVYKMQLARAVVTLYHGDAAAHAAEAEFERVFTRKEAPEDVPTICMASGTRLIAALVRANVVSSASDARRIIAQHGIEKDGKYITSADAAAEEGTYRIGKRRFLRITLS